MASTIRTQPTALRPRERLAELGVQAISTQDLLTILIGSGGHHQPVEVVASKVLQALVERDGVLDAVVLRQIKQVGLARSSMLLAALELGERVRLLRERQFLRPEDLRGYLSELRWIGKEMVVALYVSARMTIVHKEVLAVGALNQAAISPREVFSPIKQYPVAGVVIAHNHPSGDPSPSQADLLFTARVQQAGDILGVEVVDHLILAGEKLCSLRREGYIKQSGSVGSTTADLNYSLLTTYNPNEPKA